MRNLKEETEKTLKLYGKTFADIEWIGNDTGTIRIELGVFLNIANKDYDAGFGSNEVNHHLVIVGKDWWMERWEYDGSEGWHFKSKPIIHNYKFGTAVFVDGYDDYWGEIDNLKYLETKVQE